MHAMRFAKSMARLGTESAFTVQTEARKLEAAGRSIIHLEIGEPDFDTPEHIRQAAVDALNRGATHYCPPAGISELREAIAADAGSRRGVAFSPEQVVVMPGAKPVLFFAMAALIEPGDEVAYPDPGFPMYESLASFLGAIPIPVPVTEAGGFSFDLDALRARISQRTRLIILNSPHNPTGGVVDPGALHAIADLAAQHDCWILSDEIYGRLLYDGEHASVASLPGMPDRTIILDGFSKTYAMTGWRLGYGIMPAPLAAVVTTLIVNAVSCTATFTQHAGVAALTGPQEPVEAMLAEFRARRTLIVDGLNAIPGITCQLPKGAFYAFPNITALGRSSDDLAAHLLQEHGVATLSGASFGPRGEGYLRLSYANSQDNLREALVRIRAGVHSLSS